MSVGRQTLILLALTCAAGLLSGCASDAQRVASIQPAMVSHAPAASPAAAPRQPRAHPATQVNGWISEIRGPDYLDHTHVVETEPTGAYQLDTGDRLRVFVYDQPNLSRAYLVDHDGNIIVPLIGRVSVRGRTTGQVQNTVRARLAAKYIRDPQVTVDIIQNRPFFIYGEVRQAGQYPFVSGMTVQTAIAIAGGYSERASKRYYDITRRSNGYVEKIHVPTHFPLQPGDTIYVRERFF